MFWLIGWLIWVAFAYTCQWLVVAESLDTSGNWFQVAARIGTFNTFGGESFVLLSLFLFATVAAPAGYLLLDFLSRFFNNAVSALIVTALGVFTFLVGYFA